MTYLTPDEARNYKCPVARTFAEKIGPNCDADACILWRWKHKSFSGPAYDAAVKVAVRPFIGHPSSRQKASEEVRNDPEKYGLDMTPTHGTCGLGGPSK